MVRQAKAYKRKLPRRERGITLLETLLAVGLSAILSAFLVKTMQSWAEIEKASAAATYMETMSGAIGQMTQTYKNFDALFNQAELAGGTAQIGILDSEGFAISLQSGAWSGGEQLLPGSSEITESYVNLSPFRLGFTVVVSATRTGPAASDRVIEVVLASRQPVPETAARETAAKLGSSGGIVSIRSVAPASECLASGCARTLRGIYNDWKIDLARFAGTTWAADVAARPPSATDGAYVLFYRYLSAAESAGDYLYRIPVDGSPEINRMNIDLDMADNSIVGADNIRLGDMEILDYAAIEGSVAVTGNFSAQEMVVRGDTRAGTIQMARTYAADPRLNESHGGRVANTVTVDGTLVAPQVSVTSLSASDITANTLSSPTVSSNLFQHDGRLNVTTFSGDRLDSGSLTAQTLLVGSGVTIGGGQTLNASSVLVNTLNATSLSVNNLTANVSAGSTSIGLLTSCYGCW